jgi:hypothetical protein
MRQDATWCEVQVAQLMWVVQLLCLYRPMQNWRFQKTCVGGRSAVCAPVLLAHREEILVRHIKPTPAEAAAAGRELDRIFRGAAGEAQLVDALGGDGGGVHEGGGVSADGAVEQRAELDLRGAVVKQVSGISYNLIYRRAPLEIEARVKEDSVTFLGQSSLAVQYHLCATVLGTRQCHPVRFGDAVHLQLGCPKPLHTQQTQSSSQ